MERNWWHCLASRKQGESVADDRQYGYNLGMLMKAAETEVQFVDKGDRKFSIHLSGQQLAQTDNFVYLDGHV